MFPSWRWRAAGGFLVALGVFLILPKCFLWATRLRGPKEAGFKIIPVNTRPEAEEIIRLLKAGQPSERFARKHSIDPSPAEGGYFGKMGMSAVRPEIRDAVKGLTAGR